MPINFLCVDKTLEKNDAEVLGIVNEKCNIRVMAMESESWE